MYNQCKYCHDYDLSFGHKRHEISIYTVCSNEMGMFVILTHGHQVNIKRLLVNVK